MHYLECNSELCKNTIVKTDAMCLESMNTDNENREFVTPALHNGFQSENFVIYDEDNNADKSNFNMDVLQ